MAVATVHQFESGMTEASYRQERKQIRAIYGDGSSKQARAAVDQALAMLAVRSGWEIERLCDFEKLRKSQVARRLQFGRFLVDSPNWGNPEFAAVRVSLCEGKFREYWEATKEVGSNERQRFHAVQKSLLADLRIVKNSAHKPPQLIAALARFVDGAWHHESTLVLAAQKACAALAPPVSITTDDVLGVLFGMRFRQTHGVLCERRKGAKGWSYRLVRAGRTVKADAFLSEIRPIVEALKAEGRKNMATMSPWTVAQLADRLEKLLATMVAGTSEPAYAGSAPEDDSHG